MKFKRVVVLAMMVSLIISIAGCGEKKEAAYPNRAIEYVCQNAAGGSSDAFVRTVADMFSKEGIVKVPITVVNRDGGSGAVAYKYVVTKAGDPYYLLNVTASLVNTPLRSPDAPNYAQFTQIAMLASDPNCILVSAESPYKTFQDLIEAIKNEKDGINWAFSSIGSPDHVMGLELLEMTGGNIVFIPQDSDGDAVIAVLGNHADVASMAMRPALAQVQAGKMRMLAIGSAQRSETLPDVPTLKEMGYNLVVSTPRGIAAPKDISEEAKNYLIESCKKLVQTDRWKEYVKSQALISEQLYGDDFAQYLKDQTAMYEPILKEVGLIK